MFEMFKGMGQMAGILSNLPKIREEMAQLQSRLEQVTAEGDAGAGMIKAKVNGKFEILNLSISEEALNLNDREMLEDLIKSAVNQAVSKARQAAADETGKMATGLGLPPGLKLPGME